MGRISDLQAEERKTKLDLRMVATEEHLIWDGLYWCTLCIASRNQLSLFLTDPSAFCCPALVCFTPAACHTASLTPTDFQHFPSSLAVQMHLGSMPSTRPPPRFCPLPEGWKSLSSCSCVLVIPDNPAEELHWDIKAVPALSLLLLATRTKCGDY